MTVDREKKIAEMRVKAEFLDGCESKVEIDSSAIAQDYKFLLSELERLEREYAEERAAHNAHVTELCQLEEENRKLREEIASHGPEGRNYTNAEYVALLQERDKLIEGLRKLYRIMKTDHDEAHEAEAYDVCDLLEEPLEIVQNILHEIGVTVE